MNIDNTSPTESTLIELCLIMCTTKDLHSAKVISDRLVSSKLSACVTIVRGAISLYPWNGEMLRTSEVQMIIKSRLSLFKDVCRCIKESHPYEVPEIIAIRLADGDPKYISWLDEHTAGGINAPEQSTERGTDLDPPGKSTLPEPVNLNRTAADVRVEDRSRSSGQSNPNLTTDD